MARMTAHLIVISGTSRGLGLALKKEWERLGHQVIGLSRSSSPSSGNFEVDCTDLCAVKSCAEEILKDYGPPTVVVHNAGCINTPEVSWKIPPKEARAVIDSHVLGSFYLMHAFLPSMIENKQGTFVAISAPLGKNGNGKLAPYCAAKFALEGWIQSLSQELPPPLSAVAVDPGKALRTDLLKKARPEIYELSLSPDDWANKAAPFILSLSRENNGKSLVVPNGSQKS